MKNKKRETKTTKKFLFKVELGFMANISRDQAMHFLKKALKGLKDVKVGHLKLTPKKSKAVAGIEAALAELDKNRAHDLQQDILVKTSAVKAAVAGAPKRMIPVACQDWLESEAGWGQRPDGISLHFTESDRRAYLDAYWKEQPGRDANGNPPHEYSRECGSPYVVEIEEGGGLHTELLKARAEKRHGIRIFDRTVIGKLRKMEYADGSSVPMPV